VLTLTYEYKAMPTDEQVQLIEQTLKVCRKVWNYALGERKDWLNARKCPVPRSSTYSVKAWDFPDLKTDIGCAHLCIPSWENLNS
jgi:transposase